MPDTYSGKPTILVMSSTFPRWENDTEPGFVFELCRRLLNEFNVIVLAPGTAGASREEMMSGIRVIRYRYFITQWQRLAYAGGILSNIRQNPLLGLVVPFFILFQLGSLLSIIRQEKVDLIHAHWIIPQGFVAWLAKKFFNVKIPILCTSHGGDLFALKSGIFTLLRKKILSECDAITVVSEGMRRILVKSGLMDEKIKVISMGVDLSKVFIPSVKPERNSHEVLFVGRLVEKKGVTDLLHAFADIAGEFQDGHLTVIGGGPQSPMLEDLAIQLEIDSRVTFTGPLTTQDLVNYYQKATVAVFPFIIAKDGDQEGLGLVMVEALGCECPVIASDLVAVSDVIQDGINGYLVSPGDRYSIANTIKKVFNNTERAREMARTGRRQVMEKYDWEIVSGRYAEYIKSLTGKWYSSV